MGFSALARAGMLAAAFALVNGIDVQAAEPHDERYAVGWQQTSAEYRAVAIQTYKTAETRLEEALADPQWTAALEQEGTDFSGKPPAVIVDIDETLFDQTHFSAGLVKNNTPFNRDDWKKWAQTLSAYPIPGSKEFLQKAAEKNVTIFYVTNRDADMEEMTRKNLVKLGYPVSDEKDTVLMQGERKEWGRDKTSRRAFIAATHRIIILAGDDLGDFTGESTLPPGPRKDVAARHADKWGRQWFMLPNAIYGSWERALAGSAKGAPDTEKRDRFDSHLKAFTDSPAAP